MREAAIPRTPIPTAGAIAAAILVAVISLGIGARAVAKDGPEPLLDALRLVPSAAAAGSMPISYVDYDAVAEARPGALAPTSLADLLARQDADDPAAALWFAAAQGISSGPSGSC